ncbi:MAG TPA: 50S ribosomal protein L18 [Thermotogota bacterium]|nr:50S ribosomal protein L18 [Thermotogota bacterium]NLH20400.1 50S ribosomal protein L18 [Thermotogaceae bacterium]OQC31713.1 MAG: 50S ribosomal protein L18 [Thermotogota bacterium ADurb.Bin062]HNW46167.1 50S ribosomal protein L18 [Thermotogota bacterium]HNY82933.1 50S ribosomal protein L18 [Thermotogota bacterium]
MLTKTDRRVMRKRRHIRVRKKINGTGSKPRMAVFRSEKHIYVQLIDDTQGVTLLSASSREILVSGEVKKTWNKEAAKIVGKKIAEKALEKGIAEVTFDRGGYRYHGRIKELADGARAAGLKF